MNGSLKKYLQPDGFAINLKPEISELTKWYELEELSHQANKQSGNDYEQWKNLTGANRVFPCLISEVENTIKQLGGKVLAEREREREREENCQIIGLSVWN